MGVPAVIGAVGLGIQTAKGTAATAINYFPATNVDLGPDQNAQQVPPEVGGAMWPLATYKAGYMITGNVAFNPRPQSLGWLLKAFTGTATSANVGGSVYGHTFTENATKQFIPYCTVVKDVGGVWTDEFIDCRIDTFRVDIPTASIVTVQMGVVGITYGRISTPTNPSIDLGPVFETTIGQVVFTDSGDNAVHAKVTRLTLDFNNNISRAEHNVGSQTLDDVAMIRRTCRVTAEAFLSDASWYNAVYNGSTTGQAFSPGLVSAQLDAFVQTGPFVSGSTRGKMRIVIPQVDYEAYPVPMVGSDLIKVTLTSEISLSEGLGLPLYWELVNTTASYPTS